MMRGLSAVAVGVVLVLAVAMGVKTMVFGDEKPQRLPPPAVNETAGSGSGAHTETAVFAGGCFWGVQTAFERIKGVTGTRAGYSGGTKATANYEDVSSERTGAYLETGSARAGLSCKRPHRRNVTSRYASIGKIQAVS